MSAFNRLFHQLTRPWFVLVFIAFLVLSYFYFDRGLAEFFTQNQFEGEHRFFFWLTHLGIYSIYIVGFLLLALFFRYIYTQKTWEARSWFLLLAITISSLVCAFLKVTLGRARPTLWLHEQIYGFFGFQKQVDYWSFPSGHTTTIMSLAFGLAVLFPRYCYAFLVAGLLVAASRLFLVQHYLTDVLVAAYLTLLEVGLLFYFLRRRSLLAPAWQHAI